MGHWIRAAVSPPASGQDAARSRKRARSLFAGVAEFIVSWHRGTRVTLLNTLAFVAPPKARPRRGNLRAALGHRELLSHENRGNDCGCDALAPSLGITTVESKRVKLVRHLAVVLLPTDLGEMLKRGLVPKGGLRVAQQQYKAAVWSLSHEHVVTCNLKEERVADLLLAHLERTADDELFLAAKEMRNARCDRDLGRLMLAVMHLAVHRYPRSRIRAGLGAALCQLAGMALATLLAQPKPRCRVAGPVVIALEQLDDRTSTRRWRISRSLGTDNGGDHRRGQLAP